MTKRQFSRTVAFWCLLIAGTGWAGPMKNAAPSAACNQPAAKPISYVDLPARPFEPIPTADGCWIFVSLLGNPARNQSGIGVLRRSEGTVRFHRMVPLEGPVTGMVITHRQQLLIAGTGDGVAFLDPARLITVETNPVLGRLRTSSRPPSGSYVNVTSDDRLLFVSNESAGTISVINLETAQGKGFTNEALIGTIPVGRAPIAVTLSPDDRYLYSTSEVAPPEYGWPATCQPENSRENSPRPEHAPGVLFVIDVHRAATHPGDSVIAKAPAGCSPVRLMLSPSGDRAYVTARNDNALLVFDTAKLLSHPEDAQLASVPVGIAPVGVAVVEEGRKIIVANSNRFSHSNGKQNLSVIDSSQVVTNSSAVIGTVPAGVFPREIRVTADGKTLVVTNFLSQNLELIDLSRLPVEHRKR